MRVKDRQAVQRARRRAGYTQRELAFLAGCSHTTVYLIESGRMATLSDGLAFSLAKRLHCDVEDLFAERGPAAVPVVVSGSASRGAA